jgi:hypothetical protein
MIGRVTLLVDSETVGEYGDLYCNSLGAIREMVAYGGLSGVPGIMSTENLLLEGQSLPYTCTVDPLDVIEEIPVDSIEGFSGNLDKFAENSERGTFLYSILGFLGLASAASTILGICVSRRRRVQSEMQTQRTHTTHRRNADEVPTSIDMEEMGFGNLRSLTSLEEDSSFIDVKF